MKIGDFLSLKAVSADLKSDTKEGVLEELVDLLIKSNALEKKHKKKVIEVLIAREALGSTAIGQGIAIPHGKSDCINKLIGCLGISRKGINFDALDGELAHIFFLLLAPIDSAGPHLKALAKISRIFKDKHTRDSLRTAKDEDFIIKVIKLEEDRLSKL